MTTYIFVFRYILAIDNEDEIAEYVGDLLQGTDGRKRQFIDELLDRWQKTLRQTPDNSGMYLLKDSVTGAGNILSPGTIHLTEHLLLFNIIPVVYQECFGMYMT